LVRLIPEKNAGFSDSLREWKRIEKIMLPISRDEILLAISKFSEKDLRSFLMELELLLEHQKKAIPRYVGAEELDKLSGLISVGGDAVADAENIYD